MTDQEKRNERWNWMILGGFFGLGWMILSRMNRDKRMKSYITGKMQNIRKKIDLTSFINNL